MNTGIEINLNLIIEREINTGMFWGRITSGNHLLVEAASTIKELKNKIHKVLSEHHHFTEKDYFLHLHYDAADK